MTTPYAAIARNAWMLALTAIVSFLSELATKSLGELLPLSAARRVQPNNCSILKAAQFSLLAADRLMPLRALPGAVCDAKRATGSQLKPA